MASPSALSGPSKNSCCGCGPLTRSKNCAWRSWSSRTGTTASGCVSATGIRRRFCARPESAAEGSLRGWCLGKELPNWLRINEISRGAAISLSPRRDRPTRLPSTRCPGNRGPVQIARDRVQLARGTRGHPSHRGLAGVLATQLAAAPWQTVFVQWMHRLIPGLSCHGFRVNEVRLLLGVIAYSLGNLLRRLVLPVAIRDWSLTSSNSGCSRPAGG